VALGAHLTGGEIDDGRFVSLLRRLDQCAAAHELHVVAVGGYRKKVDGHDEYMLTKVFSARRFAAVGTRRPRTARPVTFARRRRHRREAAPRTPRSGGPRTVTRTATPRSDPTAQRGERATIRTRCRCPPRRT